MWTTFTKSFRLLVSLLALLLPLPFANACGISYYGEEYRVALLNPFLIGEEWSAFFYSADLINHTKPFNTGNDRRQNCREWADYMGNSSTAAEVQAVVYQANRDDLLNSIAEGAENQRFAGNSFFKTLIQNEKKPALDYLLLAKEYEYYSFLETTDPWGDSYGPTDDAVSKADEGKRTVQQKMRANYEQAIDPFLRRRYAYQLLVMNMYAGNQREFNRLYDEFFRNDKTASPLANWAHFHRSAMTIDSVEANYLYAISFARCPEKRIACYQRFDKKLTDSTLGFCKNDQERAIVLGLAAVRNPGRALSQIKRIQALDPDCCLLPLLLVREINKLEDWLLTDELTRMAAAVYPDGSKYEDKWEWSGTQWETYREANKISDKVYLAEVRDFVVKLSAQKSDPAFADLTNLFAGHLYAIESQGISAKNHLAAISPKASAGILEQQLTEQILILLDRRNLANKGTKKDLVALLVKLQAIQKNYRNGKRDFAALNRLIAEAYEKKGALATAYFFYNHALELPSADRVDFGTAYYALLRYLDWRASEKDVDAVLALLKKKDKTPFETYLTSAPLPSRNALLDLRGTISFRKNDLPEALSAFKQVQQDFWKNKYEFRYFLNSDPFVVWRDTLHRGKFPATKTAVVQRLLNLEAEAKNNPAKAAANYLTIGTAWLNCTWGGKSWMMFSYGKSYGEYPKNEWGNYSFSPPSKEMQALYYRGTRAFSYLSKAKSASKDLELQAQVDHLIAYLHSITYVLTPAEQKLVDEMPWNKTGKFYRDKEMSFYEQWVKNWGATGYYKEAVRICPVLGDYWGE